MRDTTWRDAHFQGFKRTLCLAWNMILNEIHLINISYIHRVWMCAHFIPRLFGWIGRGKTPNYKSLKIRVFHILTNKRPRLWNSSLFARKLGSILCKLQRRNFCFSDASGELQGLFFVKMSICKKYVKICFHWESILVLTPMDGQYWPIT